MATAAATRGHTIRATRRGTVVAALTALAGGAMTYMVLNVPVKAPLPGGHTLLFCPIAPLPLPYGVITKHWGPALIGLVIVVLIDSIALMFALRSPRTATPERPPPARDRSDSPLRLQRVPLRAALIAGAASLTLLIAGLMQGYAMWIPVGLALIPWVPLLALEAVWKYEHYGVWAIFGVAVLLQIGHIGEHTVQVSQLMLYHGRLAQSHGVFGQLDFETVHFIWDSAIWVLLCVVITRFARGNKWLWVAFAAASFHEVEHLYLFWTYLADPWFYTHAGLAGIMGNGGLIGSPLARPYLHFIYNFLVVVPMVLAFLDQTKHVVDRSGGARLGIRGWSGGQRPALSSAGVALMRSR